VTRCARATRARHAPGGRPVRTWLAFRGRAAGQATVELLGILPLCVAVGLGAGQLLAAGAAHELAGTAAHAGAMAILQGGDPADAARSALPGWSRSRVAIHVAGRRVRVRLRPLTVMPGLSGALAAEAAADAGPQP
jgi:hypothetical protein